MQRIGMMLPLMCLIGMASVALHAEQPADASSEMASTTPLPAADLARQIDKVVEEAAIGPLASSCSDADFVRRVNLDLTGVIPSAEQTLTFLSDSLLDKRAREIERLLASPQFNRFMTMQLTVWLLERRTEKNIPLRNWERYVYQALESDKPLDQLVSELLYADPSAGPHPATKFILTREVEPNAVTRDVGRLAFGMDLQCAQCHNHPLIDSYHQEDYYGLYAFLHRTTLFTKPSTKQVLLSEKPDGEASFRSVFTGNARDHTTPRLPKEDSLFDEPALLADQLYLEKPGKDSGGVPAFSRRQALAKMLSSSRQFRRNLANRLWALMFHRGIVHPLDFHHRDNPPANPALISLLADQLTAHGFKLRPMLAAICLSRTYQRSCEAPDPESLNYADIAARCEHLKAKLSALEPQSESLKAQATAAELPYNELLAKHDAHANELVKLLKDASEAHDKWKKADEAFQKADAPFKKSSAQHAALGSAVEKLNEAAALIPEDKRIANLATEMLAKANKLEESLPALEKAARETAATLEKANNQNAEKQKSLTMHQAQRVPSEQLRGLEQAQIEADHRLSNHLYEKALVQKQLSLCQSLADYQTLRTSDAQKAAAAWQTIVQSWTAQGQVAALKPLTPEQFTLSVMQGTGVLARFVKDANTQAQAIRAKAESKAKALAQNAEAKNTDAKNAVAKPDKPDADELISAADSLASLEQLKLVDGVRSKLDQFAALYGGLPGEDFQATVNQALFVGNGNVLDEWLKPAQNNLTEELLKADVSQVADKMMVSVLSRLPDASEKKDIEQSLSAAGVDKAQVINQWLWALLSSSEFRFNH